MPARTSLAQRFQLFDRMIAGMQDRLVEVRKPAQMMPVLRWGMDQLDATLAATAPGVRATIACRAGCDHCCSVPVDVQAHEVFFAADFLQVNFLSADFAAVVDALADHRRRVAAIVPGEREQWRSPCVLLAAGACSIYAGRPEACRSHHSHDAGLCAAHRADPAVDLTKAYIPALRARMFAVMLGMDEALESAGYDDRAYDFGSALHEALTNPLCLGRWMRRGAAFPDSCLAEPDAARPA